MILLLVLLLCTGYCLGFANFARMVGAKAAVLLGASPSPGSFSEILAQFKAAKARGELERTMRSRGLLEGLAASSLAMARGDIAALSAQSVVAKVHGGETVKGIATPREAGKGPAEVQLSPEDLAGERAKEAEAAVAQNKGADAAFAGRDFFSGRGVPPQDFVKDGLPGTTVPGIKSLQTSKGAIAKAPGKTVAQLLAGATRQKAFLSKQALGQLRGMGSFTRSMRKSQVKEDQSSLADQQFEGNVPRQQGELVAVADTPPAIDPSIAGGAGSAPDVTEVCSAYLLSQGWYMGKDGKCAHDEAAPVQNTDTDWVRKVKKAEGMINPACMAIFLGAAMIAAGCLLLGGPWAAAGWALIAAGAASLGYGIYQAGQIISLGSQIRSEGQVKMGNLFILIGSLCIATLGIIALIIHQATDWFSPDLPQEPRKTATTTIEQ